MAELTLEALAARIAASERKLAEKQPSPPDWRGAVGMFDEGAEFMELLLAEAAAGRKTGRQEVSQNQAKDQLHHG